MGEVWREEMDKGKIALCGLTIIIQGHFGPTNSQNTLQYYVNYGLK